MRTSRAHPNVYASRHVVIATIQTLLGLIGISAILLGLLPRLDLPAIPFPDLSVPDWLRTVGGWVRAVTSIPFRILGWLFAWVEPLFAWVGSWLSVPDWLRTVLRSTRWWLPILIAVLVAIEEIKRRRRQERDRAARSQAPEVATGSANSPVGTKAPEVAQDRDEPIEQTARQLQDADDAESAAYPSDGSVPARPQAEAPDVPAVTDRSQRADPR